MVNIIFLFHYSDNDFLGKNDAVDVSANYNELELDSDE